MMRILMRPTIGAAVGAGLGVLPGLVATFVPVLAIGYGYDKLLIYLGLLIGAAAGAVVGSILSTPAGGAKSR